MSRLKRIEAVQEAVLKVLERQCVSSWHVDVLRAVPREALPAIGALFNARQEGGPAEQYSEALAITFNGCLFDQEAVNAWMWWWERGEEAPPGPPAEPEEAYDRACYLSGVPQQQPLQVALGYIVEMLTTARLVRMEKRT